MRFYPLAFILVTLLDIPVQECALMEAMMQVESDDIHMASFLERFKKFIAQSHKQQHHGNQQNTSMERFIQTNDSFQANYDFGQNLLTVHTSYSLLLNETNTKISDVKIIVTFKFQQSSHEKILLEDIYGHRLPTIGLADRFHADDQNIPNNESSSQRSTEPGIFSNIIHFINDIIEPVVVTLIQIVFNGVLGHALTTAFEQLYTGHLHS